MLFCSPKTIQITDDNENVSKNFILIIVSDDNEFHFRDGQTSIVSMPDRPDSAGQTRIFDEKPGQKFVRPGLFKKVAFRPDFFKFRRKKNKFQPDFERTKPRFRKRTVDEQKKKGDRIKSLKT